MLAQPGHPVFLDVLGRIIRDVAKHRSVSADYTKGQFKEEISKETLFNVVSWTFLHPEDQGRILTSGA
jgi:hypothetical protein